MDIRRLLSSDGVVAASLIFISILCARPASAESCYDLWYDRNEIYADAGYCFKSRLGQETFGNKGCFTSSPNFNDVEALELKLIRREEKRRGCKVN